MALDQCGDSSLEARLIDAAVEPQDRRHVVCGAIREQPRPHPEPMLLRAEPGAGPIRRHVGNRRSRRRPGQPGSHAVQRHSGVQQLAQRQPDAVPGVDEAHEPDSGETVPTGVQEADVVAGRV
jgi:hypothetical protein